MMQKGCDYGKMRKIQINGYGDGNDDDDNDNDIVIVKMIDMMVISQQH